MLSQQQHNSWYIFCGGKRKWWTLVGIFCECIVYLCSTQSKHFYFFGIDCIRHHDRILQMFLYTLKLSIRYLRLVQLSHLKLESPYPERGCFSSNICIEFGLNRQASYISCLFILFYLIWNIDFEICVK